MRDFGVTIFKKKMKGDTKMARAKAMTYEELIEYARKHYNRGGDGIFECWDERTYNEYVKEFGPITKRKALAMFKDWYEHERELMVMANW